MKLKANGIEINYVIEGELHVDCDGSGSVVGPGDFVVVPAGSRARYAAPTYATHRQRRPGRWPSGKSSRRNVPVSPTGGAHTVSVSAAGEGALRS